MNTAKAWTDLASASYQISAMALEAQAVIWMRLWGMAGVWNVPPGENDRMVAEKLSAAFEAQRAMVAAMSLGGSPAEIASSAIRPLRRKTASNLSRLSKRGPKLG